jgi:hypothetical protein
MNKNIYIGMLMFVCLVGFVSAGQVCTNGVSTTTDGSDYFGISDSGVNTSVVSVDNLWTSWDYFTPRLNFTRNVTEQFYGTMNTTYSYFSWKTPLNFSSSLVVLNGTTVIPASNYSLRNLTATQWVLDWKDSRYNTTLVTVYFNRTFIKNVDDIVLNPSAIYIGATRSSFLVESTPTAYGDDKTFQFTTVSPGQLGEFINVSNWAIGWNLDVRICESCSSGETGLFNAMKVFLILFGLLILVGGFYLYKQGMIETKGILFVVIGTIIYFALLPAIRSLLMSYGC